MSNEKLTSTIATDHSDAHQADATGTILSERVQTQPTPKEATSKVHQRRQQGVACMGGYTTHCGHRTRGAEYT